MFKNQLNLRNRRMWLCLSALNSSLAWGGAKPKNSLSLKNLREKIAVNPLPIAEPAEPAESVATCCSPVTLVSPPTRPDSFNFCQADSEFEEEPQSYYSTRVNRFLFQVLENPRLSVSRVQMISPKYDETRNEASVRQADDPSPERKLSGNSTETLVKIQAHFVVHTGGKQAIQSQIDEQSVATTTIGSDLILQFLSAKIPQANLSFIVQYGENCVPIDLDTTLESHLEKLGFEKEGNDQEPLFFLIVTSPTAERSTSLPKKRMFRFSFAEGGVSHNNKKKSPLGKWLSAMSFASQPQRDDEAARNSAPPPPQTNIESGTADPTAVPRTEPSSTKSFGFRRQKSSRAKTPS